MRHVQRPSHIWSHGEVKGSDTLYCCICTIVGDGEELGTAEAVLWAAAWSEDGLVVDSDLHGFADCGEIKLRIFNPMSHLPLLIQKGYWIHHSQLTP